MGYTVESGTAHRELFGLLSEADHKFALAVKASVNTDADITGPGAQAGSDIFEATRDALIQAKVDLKIPTLDDNWQNHPLGAILPIPILIALSYFTSQQEICLGNYHLSAGNAAFDWTHLPWSHTLFRGYQPKIRFFNDLTDYFHFGHVKNPFLSHNRLRAVQLLVVAQHLTELKLKKIGLPEQLKIFLPDC